jgi:hypothetical protein
MLTAKGDHTGSPLRCDYWLGGIFGDSVKQQFFTLIFIATMTTAKSKNGTEGFCGHALLLAQ